MKYVTSYCPPPHNVSYNGSPPPKKRIKIKNSSPEKHLSKQTTQSDRIFIEQSLLNGNANVFINNLKVEPLGNNFMDIFQGESEDKVTPFLNKEELKSSEINNCKKILNDGNVKFKYKTNISNKQNLKSICDKEFTEQRKPIKKPFRPSQFWKNHTGNIKLKALNINGELRFVDFNNCLVTFCGNCANCKKSEDCMKCKHCK